MCWAGLGCNGLYWDALGCTGLYWAVQLVRMISLDDMHSENIWFSWSKPSNYQGKLRCHTRDGRTDGGGKWKIGQCSVGPETAILLCPFFLLEGLTSVMESIDDGFPYQ